MSDNDEPTPRDVPGAPQPPASSLPPQPAHPAGHPGLIPGAAAPPPPTFGAPGYGVAMSATGAPVEKPTRLANAFIGITGAYAAVTVVLAAFARSDIAAIEEFAETREFTLGTSTLLQIVLFPLLVASFVVYGLWMTRMRRNREALGARPGLPAVEWWGWFVPLASLALIPVGARKVTGPAVSLGLLLGWWLLYLASTITSAIGSVILNTSIDPMTLEITNAAALDSYPTYMWAAAGLLLVSWGFLVPFIRQATDRHTTV